MHAQEAEIGALRRQLEGMQAAASHARWRRRRAQDQAMSADKPAIQMLQTRVHLRRRRATTRRRSACTRRRPR